VMDRDNRNPLRQEPHHAKLTRLLRKRVRSIRSSVIVPSRKCSRGSAAAVRRRLGRVRAGSSEWRDRAIEPGAEHQRASGGGIDALAAIGLDPAQNAELAAEALLGMGRERRTTSISTAASGPTAWTSRRMRSVSSRDSAGANSPCVRRLWSVGAGRRPRLYWLPACRDGKSRIQLHGSCGAQTSTSASGHESCSISKTGFTCSERNETLECV
jgi:hypothetical protein